MKIGNIEIDRPVLLAPMAGVTDLPFRLLCKKMGADLMYTEFVSSNGIIRENQKTLDLIKFMEEERPIGVQIFGEFPDVMAKSAKMIYDMFKPDIIDINYGCPVPKVTNKGAGSAALKDLCLMEDITSAVVDSVKEIPVTVKMRSGWDASQQVYLEAASILERSGVSAITLHPRTTSQKFKGNADWTLIEILKKHCSIPIIGNGDVKDLNDYIQIRQETNCDAVMIGRGALGRPWIFKDIKDYKNDKKITPMSTKNIIKICIEHYKLLREHKNEKVCANLTKKHFSWYLKGFRNASNWRKKVLFAKDLKQIESVIFEMEDYSNSV